MADGQCDQDAINKVRLRADWNGRAKVAGNGAEPEFSDTTVWKGQGVIKVVTFCGYSDEGPSICARSTYTPHETPSQL